MMQIKNLKNNQLINQLFLNINKRNLNNLKHHISKEKIQKKTMKQIKVRDKAREESVEDLTLNQIKNKIKEQDVSDVLNICFYNNLFRIIKTTKIRQKQTQKIKSCNENYCI